MKKSLSLFLAIILILALLTTCVMAADGSTTVYVTNTGECYHSAGCQYLKKSCNAISLQDAVSGGYRACSKCNPPALTSSASSSSYSYSSADTVSDYSYVAPSNNSTSTIQTSLLTRLNKDNADLETALSEASTNNSYTLMACVALAIVCVVLFVKYRKARKQIEDYESGRKP